MTEEKIYQAIISRINTLEDYSLDFVFSSTNSPYLNIESITLSFQREWEGVREFLKNEDFEDKVVSMLFPKKPYDLSIIEKIRNFFPASSPDNGCIFLDMCIAKILYDLAWKYRRRVSHQLLLELLNIYKLRTPEFLIVVKAIILVIIDRDKCFSHIVKSSACEVLINNYESEALFIFVSCAPELKAEEKHVLFQRLTAFQKIYRKLLEMHIGLPEKDIISQKWFNTPYDILKQKRELRDSFSNLVRRFVSHLKRKEKMEAIKIGRFLVLRFNNEDILRVVYHEITKDPDLLLEGLITRFIYRQIYKVMQEFRKDYISQKVDSKVTQVISETEAKAISAMSLITAGKVPASVVLKGRNEKSSPSKNYSILQEFMEKLIMFNLQALYELHSIPKISQQVVVHMASIADNMNLERDELFHFIFYMENLLFFLQELEEMDIVIDPGRAYSLIKNPFQLSSLNLMREGTYFASTGLWYENTIPPSIIRCISPNALPNCLGVKERHIFCRVSLLTGGFRGNPFDLDSTNRYNWDEEPESCIFRPGYLQITIPQPVYDRWGKTQRIQTEWLRELIHQKKWN